MSIQELIDILQKQPDKSKRVIASGYEGGFHDLAEPQEIPIKLNDWNIRYYGPHEQASTDEPFDEVALLIRIEPNPNVTQNIWQT
jgi:hypothetical protein